MTGTLRCYSFHSVKGGVGKSTLSVLTAVALADEHPEARVYLVDMDLTGTSVADVLPLEAPRWEGVADGEPLDLLKPPSGFHDHERTRDLVEVREESTARAVVGVPFLNDYLLFETPDWDEETDLRPESIAWRLRGGPDGLRVLPSSALPRDLERALPVIYDEEHAAYLEGRLEYLLAALVAGERDVFVVFDTPPTIPGLSRSVLSLALRLSREPKETLSADGDMPRALKEADVRWRAFIVATLDHQDVAAAWRWFKRVEDAEIIRLVLNRTGGTKDQMLAQVEDILRGSHTPGPADPDAVGPAVRLAGRTRVVAEDRGLAGLFRGKAAPPVLRDLLRRLDDDRDA
jgi:hypothetical protein